MSASIVVGFDGGSQSRDALALGEVIARSLNAKLVLACVRPPGSARAEAEAVLDAAPAGDGIEVERVALEAQSAAQGLHDLAARSSAAAVVLGSSREATAGRVVSGSVGGRLLDGAPCAVALAPLGYGARERAARVVAVAFDGSPESGAAARGAAAIALGAGASLRLIAVIDPHDEDLDAAVTQLAGSLPDALEVDVRVKRGGAAEQILAECASGVDLLALGSRGYGPRAVLLGSVSARVVDAAACPVVVFPRGVDPPAAPAGGETEGAGMLLVGWNGGEPSRDGMALAVLLARECGFSLRVVHCYPGDRGYPVSPELAGELEAEAARALERVPRDALRDIPVTTQLVAAGSAAEGLQHEAEQSGAHMVVLGPTHRVGLGRVLPGPVAENLLHGSPCAVAVAPVGYAGAGEDAIRMVAVAYDASEESRAAVDEAVALAKAAGAGLKVITVTASVPPSQSVAGVSPEAMFESDVDAARASLAELIHELPSELRPDARFRTGDPAARIAAECEVGVDLLVIGSRGYGTVRRVLLGSVSSEVIRSVACPVVVVPRRAQHQ